MVGEVQFIYIGSYFILDCSEWEMKVENNFSQFEKASGLKILEKS